MSDALSKVYATQFSIGIPKIFGVLNESTVHRIKMILHIVKKETFLLRHNHSQIGKTAHR